MAEHVGISTEQVAEESGFPIERIAGEVILTWTELERQAMKMGLRVYFERDGYGWRKLICRRGLALQLVASREFYRDKAIVFPSDGRRYVGRVNSKWYIAGRNMSVLLVESSLEDKTTTHMTMTIKMRQREIVVSKNGDQVLEYRDGYGYETSMRLTDLEVERLVEFIKVIRAGKD